MINAQLLWYLLVPIFLSAFTIFIMHKFENGITWELSFVFTGIGLLISAIILSSAFYIGKGAKTADIEIWNGEVVSKARTHGSYIESYQCNCRTVTSGSGKDQTTTTVCDTCYRDHYTVSWDCATNIGRYNIDSKDWTSRAVYLVSDPNRYTIIKNGDPVSKTHGYINYIKAVPETLFRPAQESLKARFIGKIPEYPINIYDYYHINRVLPVDVSMPDVAQWNLKLSEMLKKLGPAKQANVVIVVTKEVDQMYFNALQDAWLNGKKNDIVVVIGAPEFPRKAAWVNIMALSQDNIFQVKLRDDILNLDSLTADNVINTIATEATATFKRKRMHDFDYLDAEIDPPDWVMELAVGFILLAYIGFWVFIYKESKNSSRFSRFRRF